MKQVMIYGLLVAMLLLAGCPVLTKNSIDEGSYAIPSTMNGVWHEMESTGKVKKTYLIKTGNRKGTLTGYDADGEGTPYASTPVTNVIMSTVKGKVFFFVYKPEDDMDPAGYYIFEFQSVSDKEFKLVPVKEHAVDYNASPEEIAKFLEQNKDNKGIYDLGEVLRYVKR
jgi:hypothetical protein